MSVLKGLHPAGAHQIRADIGGAPNPQRQKTAIGSERQRGFGVMVAGLMVGQETFAAGGDPFDRPADAPGRPQRQYMLRIDEVLCAEATPDIRRNKSDRAGRHPQCAGGVVARAMNALARDIARVPATIGIPKTNDTARLHWIGDDPVIVEIELDQMGRCREPRVDRGGVSCPPIEADISRDFRGNFRRASGASGNCGGDGRQRRIVDNHLLGSVERLGAGRGDDERDRLTDIADLCLGQ